MVNKLQLEPFYAPCKKKKRLSANAASKKVCDVEKGSGTINEHIAQNWFTHFTEGNTSLKDKTKSGRPFVAEDKASRYIKFFTFTEITTSILENDNILVFPVFFFN